MTFRDFGEYRRRLRVVHPEPIATLNGMSRALEGAGARRIRIVERFDERLVKITYSEGPSVDLVASLLEEWRPMGIRYEFIRRHELDRPWWFAFGLVLGLIVGLSFAV